MFSSSRLIVATVATSSAGAHSVVLKMRLPRPNASAATAQ
jgi:hypothetical protein